MGRKRDDGKPRLVKIVMPCSASQKDTLRRAHRLRSFDTGNLPPVLFRPSLSKEEREKFREDRKLRHKVNAGIAHENWNNNMHVDEHTLEQQKKVSSRPFSVLSLTRLDDTETEPRKGETRLDDTETEPRKGETRLDDTETEPRKGETRLDDTETEPRKGETEMIMERDETETRKNRDDTRARHRDFSKISRRDDTLLYTLIGNEISSVSKKHRRQGLASKFMNWTESKELLKSLEATGIVTEASSLANQVLLSKQGNLIICSSLYIKCFSYYTIILFSQLAH
ncbi:unnamed protein product [Caenorhabditis sp. 36 PRJEB53466]|nr:unnamed protein product [Caenorhabditis sp. 36 PRJEB53466]